MAGKTTARERLARLLKQGSSIPEVREFRSQARDVCAMGGPLGLDSWIEARRDLGLLSGRLVNRAADDLQGCICSLIEEATKPASPAPPAGPSWEERQRLINERETKRRQNVAPVGYRPPPHQEPKPKRKRKPRVQRQRPLSPTTSPDPKRLSLLERMALAWDRLSQGHRHE